MVVAVTEFPGVETVDYDTLRPEIRSGDILLCSGSAVISRLIQQVTGSVWSHVAFVIRLDSLERVMVLESVESDPRGFVAPKDFARCPEVEAVAEIRVEA